MKVVAPAHAPDLGERLMSLEALQTFGENQTSWSMAPTANDQNAAQNEMIPATTMSFAHENRAGPIATSPPLRRAGAGLEAARRLAARVISSFSPRAWRPLWIPSERQSYSGCLNDLPPPRVPIDWSFPKSGKFLAPPGRSAALGYALMDGARWLMRAS